MKTVKFINCVYSLSNVPLYVYCQFFACIGGHNLWHILAGLDPNRSSFGILPPNWTTSHPLENNLIKRAIVVLYGPILVVLYDCKPELLHYLPYLVFNSVALLEEVMVKHPAGHGFTKIYILHNHGWVAWRTEEETRDGQSDTRCDNCGNGNTATHWGRPSILPKFDVLTCLACSKLWGTWQQSDGKSRTGIWHKSLGIRSF